MAATILYDDRVSSVPSAQDRDGDLWLSFEDLANATGWEWKPQGMCRGDACIPVAPDRANALVSGDGCFNLSAFARDREQPVVCDGAASVWSFGETAATHGDALRSLEAPDFCLPDLDGVVRALSDYRGKKVLLLSWASW